MDLKENIRIAAEVYSQKGKTHYRDLECGFIDGALSLQAKDYWYNEFKTEQVNEMLADIGRDIFPPTIEPIVFSDGSIAEPLKGYGEHVNMSKGLLKQIENIPPINMSNLPCELQFDDGTPEIYQQYLKDNPDRPISFDNWKYMVEYYPNEQVLTGDDKLDNILSKGISSKHIGIIGHVDHRGSSLFADRAQKVIIIKGRNSNALLCTDVLEEAMKERGAGIVVSKALAEEIEKVILENDGSGILNQINRSKPFVMTCPTIHEVMHEHYFEPKEIKPWDRKHMAKKSNHKKKRK